MTKQGGASWRTRGMLLLMFLAGGPRGAAANMLRTAAPSGALRVFSSKSTVVSCAAATGAPLKWTMDHAPSNDGRPIFFNAAGALGKPLGAGTTFSATFDWDTNPQPGEPLPFEAEFMCGKFADGRETSTLPFGLGTFSVPTYETCPTALHGGVELSLLKLSGSWLKPQTRRFDFHFEYGDGAPRNAPFACFDAHVEFTVW